MMDHTQLVSLVPENGGAARSAQACRRCLGYVKNFTRLQGAPATQVILDDLASADIDVAAVEEGYRRPEGPGYSLRVTINGKKS
jgi:FdhE protein